MAKKRLLLIEDDADVAELLLMYFSGQGYEILHADSGSEGIALARSRFPNLILLDIMLPDMEGFAVCQTLRAASLTKYIPTIFLTQRDTQRDKIAGLELGADDYITKPFDIEELKLRVQSSIRRATREHLHEEITGLPSGPFIEEEHRRFFAQDEAWSSLELSLEGFDAFRDAYGFITANDALSLAAKVLMNTLSTHGTPDDFVGTVNTAQFVIYTFSNEVARLVEEIQNEFRQKSEALYRFTDLERGAIVMEAGSESEHEVPLMRFSVTVKHLATS